MESPSVLVAELGPPLLAYAVVEAALPDSTSFVTRLAVFLSAVYVAFTISTPPRVTSSENDMLRPMVNELVNGGVWDMRLYYDRNSRVLDVDYEIGYTGSP